MASYTVTQRIYHYDSFESEDIPEGLTPAEYAEERYGEGFGDLDSHELLVLEGDTVIYEGSDSDAAYLPREGRGVVLRALPRKCDHHVRGELGGGVELAQGLCHIA